MDSLTLKQLRYFEAVASACHFGRAAEACAVSQPALSVQIKDLEQALGLQLFERRPRQASLTPFGEDFAKRVRGILQGVDGLQDLARAARGGLGGRLRLGVIPTIAPYLLPRLLPRLTSAIPGIDVQVRETITPRLTLDVLDGRIDAAIVALPIDEPGLTEFELFREDLVLVRHESDADAPTPGPENLTDMRLLLLEEGHCFRDQALSFCSTSAARRREGLDGSSLSTLVQMVGAGIGVTLIPEMAIPVEVPSAAVSIARFDTPRPTRTVGMVWRTRNPMGEKLAEVAALVSAAAADG